MPDYWYSTDREMRIIYTSAIDKGKFSYMSKDEWFKNQISKTYKLKFNFFSFFILTLSLLFYFFFFYVVIFAKLIDFVFIFDCVYLNIWWSLFYVYIIYFIVDVIRSLCGMRSSWFFTMFDFYSLGIFFDILTKDTDLFIDISLSNEDEFYFFEHPFVVFNHDGWYEGDEDINDNQCSWSPDLDDLEFWVCQYNISRDWSSCKTIVFDSFANSYVFKFYNYLNYLTIFMIGLNLGTRLSEPYSGHIYIFNKFYDELRQSPYKKKRKKFLTIYSISYSLIFFILGLAIYLYLT